jgi:hypothetical protein
LGEKKVFRKVENFMSGCKSKKDIFKMQFQSRVSAKKQQKPFKTGNTESYFVILKWEPV